MSMWLCVRCRRCVLDVHLDCSALSTHAASAGTARNPGENATLSGARIPSKVPILIDGTLWRRRHGGHAGIFTSRAIAHRARFYLHLVARCWRSVSSSDTHHPLSELHRRARARPPFQLCSIARTSAFGVSHISHTSHHITQQGPLSQTQALASRISSC